MSRTTDDLHNFDEYVMNDTPILLIRLSNVALVELDDALGRRLIHHLVSPVIQKRGRDS